MIVDRREMRSTIGRVLAMLAKRPPRAHDLPAAV
jgi:acetyl-CoA carboxylase beta subunit